MLRRALVTRLGAARRLLQQAPSAPAPSASHLAPLSPPSTSALLLGASHTSAASQLAGGAGQEDATNRAGDATGAVASAADAGAFAPAATPGAATGGERIEKAAGMAPAELTAEDYQQLTPEEFAAVADLYLGEHTGCHAPCSSESPPPHPTHHPTHHPRAPCGSPPALVQSWDATLQPRAR
jgi:hypothetical protein